jgi:hypothetical protein
MVALSMIDHTVSIFRSSNDGSKFKALHNRDKPLVAAITA